MHWATQYIGRDWCADGGEPYQFNCWSFVRYIYKNHFACELPLISVDAENILELTRAFNRYSQQPCWQQVDRPSDGNCVLMRMARYPIHVGIWLENGGDSGVLHCARLSGVVFQNKFALELHGWRVEGFYLWLGGR